MKITKLSRIAMLLLSMCILLSSTVFAVENGVTYSAKAVGDSVFCKDETNRTVTFDLKSSETLMAGAFEGTVTAPDGWEVTIENEKLSDGSLTLPIEPGFFAGDDFFFWFAADNIAVDLFAQVTVKIPDNIAAGNYTVTFELNEISKDAGDTLVASDITVTATVTINAGHDFSNGDCPCGEQGTSTGSLKGDVDLDGDVDIDDVTYLAKHVAKILNITNSQSLENADVTGDGATTIDDVTKVAKYVAKIIPDLN